MHGHANDSRGAHNYGQAGERGCWFLTCGSPAIESCAPACVSALTMSLLVSGSIVHGVIIDYAFARTRYACLCVC